MKSGLIIAGPILSPGYTPYFFDECGNYRKIWVDFDSSTNILNLISEASALFDCVVLVTWKSIQSSNFLTFIRSTTKVEIIELTENAFLNNQLNNNGTSKYHQIETMYAGAKKLRELECEIIAKVRTTHGINLNILFNEVLKHKKRNRMSIGVSYMNLFEPDRLVDYNFVGNADVIESLCKYYLSTPERSQGVHEDYFLKFSSFLSGKINAEADYDKKFQFRKKIEVISIWTQFFYPINRKLLQNFFWRGIKVNSTVNFWIFWSWLFHAKDNRYIKSKLIGNFFLIVLARSLTRPLIRIYSFFSFRFYRFLATRERS